MSRSFAAIKKFGCAAFVLVGGMSLAACGPSENWSYSDEELMKAVEVKASIQMDSTLHISLVSSDAIFKTDISTESVFIAPKVSDSTGKSKTVTFEQLKKQKIENFKIDHNDEKVLTVSFEDYDITTYYVFVGKGATVDSNIILGTASLISHSTESIPIFGLDSGNYYSGQTNPVFEISADNVEIADKSKIAFDGAFANLTAGDIAEENGTITLNTTGSVDAKATGTILLREGFFKDVEGDIPIYADVLMTAAYVDQATFLLTGRKFTFDLVSTSSDYVKTFATNALSFDASLDKIAVGQLTRKDDKTMTVECNLTGSDFEKVEDVLDYLHGYPLVLNNALKDMPGVFEVALAVNYPSLGVYPVLDMGTHKLTISARLYNCQEVTFTQNDFSLFNTNIDTEGEDKNATLSNFEQETNGFRVTYDLNDNFSERVYGTLKINANKAKAFWGEGYERTRYFDTAGIQPLKDNAVGADTDPQVQEEFEEKLASIQLDWDDGQKIILALATLAQLSISLEMEHYDSAFGSFIEIFKIFGLNGHSDEPTVQNVLNKLDTMDQKLDSLSHQLDKLGETIDVDTAALALGIDRILYNQYQTNWNNFLTNYKDKMEDMIRNFQSKYRDGFVKLIGNTDSIDFKVSLIAQGDTYVYTTPDPNRPLYSMDGKELDLIAKGSIPMSYFQDVIDDFNANKRYSDNFESLFKQGIQDYLEEHPNPNYGVDEVFASIQDTINFQSVTEQEALDFSNLVINYARAIYGDSGKTCLSDYFSMMQSFYNFQGETSKLFNTMRGSLQLDLLGYTVFAQNFAKYSGTQIDQDKIKETVSAANDFVASYTGLTTLSANTEYAYALNSKITGKMVDVSFEVSYNPKNSNDTTFKADLCTWQLDGTIGRKGVNYVNNSTLLSRNDLLKLFQRYRNLASSGVSVASTFPQYMINAGILQSNAQAIYDSYKTYSTATAFPGVFPVIASFDGIQALTSENWACECKCAGNGEYFVEGTNYTYKGKRQSGDSTENDCWQGQEAKGTLLDLNSMNQISTVLDRYGRYDETHWYWNNDEHHAFEMYNLGIACAAFLRV